MIVGVEGSAETEKGENGEGTRVRGEEDVIGELEESSFCAYFTHPPFS